MEGLVGGTRSGGGRPFREAARKMNEWWERVDEFKARINNDFIPLNGRLY